MTERELNQLKSMVSSLDEPLHSAKLDETIKMAARAQRTAVPQDVNQRAVHQLIPIAASLLITMGAFFMMSEMISSKQSPVKRLASADDLKFHSGTLSEPLKQTDQNQLSKPARRILAPESSPTYNHAHNSESLISSDLVLPSTESLLDAMDFVIESDRSEAQQAIDLALVDIKSLLIDGSVDDARKRYDRLRRSCTICQLPSNLEALASLSNSSKSQI